MVATDSQPAMRVAFVTDNGSVVENVSDSVFVSVVGTAGPVALSGATRVRAENGVATLNLQLRSAGTGYRLQVSTPRFATSAVSNAFAVVAGAASAVQVSSASRMFIIGDSVPITARIVDAFGNVVSSASHAVTLSALGHLHGATTTVAAGGIARFPNIQVCAGGVTARIGASPVLIHAHAERLTPGTDTVLGIAGPPVGVAWVTQPTDGKANEVLSQFRVMVHDCGGNPVYGSLPMGWGVCTPSLHANPTGAALVSVGAGHPMTSSWAYATNQNAAVDRAGTGYTLVVRCREASSGHPEFTTAPSNPFNVLP